MTCCCSLSYSFAVNYYIVNREGLSMSLAPGLEQVLGPIKSIILAISELSC